MKVIRSCICWEVERSVLILRQLVSHVISYVQGMHQIYPVVHPHVMVPMSNRWHRKPAYISSSHFDKGELNVLEDNYDRRKSKPPRIQLRWTTIQRLIYSLVANGHPKSKDQSLVSLSRECIRVSTWKLADV
jgi:hypothetical protein